MNGLSSSYNAQAPVSALRCSGTRRRFSCFPDGFSTNLRDVLGVRRGGVGGDGATGQRSKSLATQRRSLTGRSTEEHVVRRKAQLKMGELMVGDSDTFPSDVGNANFPDYLSASRSGAAGVSTLQTVQTAELAYS